MSGNPVEPGYTAGPTFFWAIALLDLGVFLPATVATCVGLRRRADWARKALYLVGGWFGLVGPAVAAMAIAMKLIDDPNASVAGAVSMTALGVAFAVLALVLYRPLLRPPAPTTSAAIGDLRVSRSVDVVGRGRIGRRRPRP